MRLAISLGILLACVAPALSPSAARAQGPIVAPPPANAVSPGFNHRFEAGLVRTDSGWVARDYPKVSAVTAGSAAARAGVRVGDVIVAANGQGGRKVPLLRGLRRGDTIVMRIRRGDEEREIRYRLDP